MKRKLLLLISGIFTAILMTTISTEARVEIKPIPYIEGGGGGGTTYANSLVEGRTYSQYKYIPYLSGESVPVGTIYGNLVKSNSDSDPIYKAKQTYKAGTWLAGKDDYKDFDTYRYSIYKMPIVCNLPYESYNQGFYRQGDSESVTWSKTESTSYETSVETTLKASTSLETGVKASIKMFEVGISKTSQIEGSISSSWTKTTSTSVTESRTRNYVINESGYYFKQRRAFYDMYVILSFEIPYSKTMTHAYEGWWYREWYNYERQSGYIFRGYQVYYKFRTDLSDCFVRYSGDSNGNLVFADQDYKNVNGTQHLYI